MNERKLWSSEVTIPTLRRIIDSPNLSTTTRNQPWNGTKSQKNSTKHPSIREPASSAENGKNLPYHRWHNQLKPGIENDRNWTENEVDKLLKAQGEVGNKWAHIAKELPGRTDNSIKNFFYSTLRKALRKVNCYVVCHRKEPFFKNIKEFKNCVLSKLLAVSEGRHEGKMYLKTDNVFKGARGILTYM